jgi:hypothetical protein
MRVVSENSERDLAILRAGENVEDALRPLAADILRVARGAGRPEEILRLAAKLVVAAEDYRSVAGDHPIELLAAVLRGWSQLDPGEGAQWQRSNAERRMVRGALQHVASQLLDQRTHATAGRDELYDGLIEIEGLRAEARRQVRAAERLAKAARARRKRKPGPRAKSV